MRYALIFLILTVNFARADDENFTRKAAKHYNLTPLSDYIYRMQAATFMLFLQLLKGALLYLGVLLGRCLTLMGHLMMIHKS